MSTTTSTPYTPAVHAETAWGKTMQPVKLLHTGRGEHGANALIEFEGGFTRSIDLTCPADAWHPMFTPLTWNERHQLRDLAAIRTELPGGLVKIQESPLSFVTETRTKRGKWVRQCSFDVPDEEYGAGNVTGYRVALELMQHIKAGGDAPSVFLSVLLDAAKAQELTTRQPSKCGAASNFLRTVESYFVWAVQHAKFEPHLTHLIDDSMASHGRYKEWEQEAIQRRVARMVAARKAKREAVQIGGAA